MRFLSIVLALCIPFAAMAEDGQNDIKNPIKEPNSVHVAICNGSDVNKREVVLVDRLCLNRESSAAILAGVNKLQEDRDRLIVELNKANQDKADADAEANKNIILSAVGGAGVAAVVITGILLGLKATGNLK